ncbi:hypothetical protein AWV80_36560 [Cupriavidus sp. UYMU48A]|nr:hypothetical protein AWV80_36560 [Cupriavidus sp. UYMU48A]
MVEPYTKLLGEEREGTGSYHAGYQRHREYQCAATQDHQTRGHFPSDEAATKLLWLALRNITGKWGSSTHDWKAAMIQFAILYEERFTHPHR